ncbi:hypothetical protein [Terribacillus sp. DMT04]|uniref:hypothetical protein n=1 Tax=Terribacillus sp. DMT04 TaxID=2850441 RepID=UPI001C2C5602|nr:hypothetical protein [Terribacillus sp. DMT04]QXE02316.1 hypothetical protein KS242_03555 [Terribacillus sp. DMT04]
MKLIKSLSIGFLVFILLYIVGVIIALPVIFDLLDKNVSLDLQLFGIPLAAIVHNTNEMYGGVSIWGILAAGTLGGIINYSIFLLFNRKHA